MYPPHFRHEGFGAAIPFSHHAVFFDKAEVELGDGRLDATQWWVINVGKAHVQGEVAGGVVGERAQLAFHLGVGIRPFSRGALFKRVPDCGIRQIMYARVAREDNNEMSGARCAT